MRDHVPKVDRARRRVGGGAGLVFLLLLIGGRIAHGQGPPPGETGATTTSVIPIALAADRVRVWDEGSTRHVVLEGRAAVTQGSDALRAPRILVRIQTETNRGTRSGYVVDTYTDPATTSRTPASASARAPRSRFMTRGEVRVTSYKAGGLARLEREPDDVPGLRDAFAAAPVALDPAAVAKVDNAVQRAQFGPEGFDGGLGGDEPAQIMPNPDPSPDLNVREPSSMPMGGDLAPPSELPGVVVPGAVGPILPDSRRVVTIGPRDSGQNAVQDGRLLPDGRFQIILRGGVNITVEAPGQGTIDISADNAVVWTRFGENGEGPPPGAGTGGFGQDSRMPLEIYLEGNVICRQDQRKVAGNGDQIVTQASQFYVDIRQQKFIAPNAELDLFAPQLLTPIKTKARMIRQHRSLLGMSGTTPIFGPSQVRAEDALITGSRFPVPGYRFQSRSIDITEQASPLIGPDGRPVGNPEEITAPEDRIWRVDARQNIFKIGPIPVFYWPRLVTDSDDLDPPLRQFQFRANNYFGQQLLTDWSMFKILGLRRPTWIDNWNLDIDYLSYRGVALGSETGWSGRNLFDDLTDPYHRLKTGPSPDRAYFGYSDGWGLKDHGIDVLGPGPAVVTNGPPGAGKAGFQRTSDPPFQDFRGRTLFRHMQYLTGSDAPADEEMRLQIEAAYVSDRNFLEQYYKRLFDTGLDQATLGYFIRQRGNTAFTVLAQPNLQPWYTDTQWFPKLDYYRLGDSFFGLFTYWTDSGADYANTHTDVMVNNPNIFAFIPYDPVSATSGAFRTGRLWTSHELAMPLNLGLLRVTPYVQGQLTGWDNQYATAMPALTSSTVLPNTAFIRGPQGAMLGRAWGAAGARMNIMLWRTFPQVESELFNLHGLAHKMNFDLDYRGAYSNVPLGRIGVQDQLDDNTYEYVRRYFALINYAGGVLPAQYDPRFLTLRRQISPITGTTDVQDSIQTMQMALRQRLQTKRGPEGQQRVIDWMTLDLSAVYFPNANRDNFGQPFGLMQYNYEWFLGDRTSFVSSGWFENWDVTGQPILISNPRHINSPFGLNVVTTGISLARPPRGNIFLGYSVIDTGVIATSALNVSMSYWLSPKWYGSFSTSYDFGNAILLGSTFGVTRVGADFLTSIGLTVDPQRNSYMFGFELTPRLSPNLRFGSGGGLARFDPRFAPTQ